MALKTGEQNGVPWYTGLLILIFILPVLIKLLYDPLQLVFGNIDHFNMPEIGWIRLIFLSIGIGFLVVLISKIEWKILHNNQIEYEPIEQKAKLLTLSAITIYYLFLAGIFTIFGELNTVLIMLISLVVVILVTRWTVSITSMEFNLTTEKIVIDDSDQDKQEK